jgi:hypothetical protein
MTEFKTSIPATAQAADRAGENCELSESAPQQAVVNGDHGLTGGSPAADADAYLIHYREVSNAGQVKSCTEASLEPCLPAQFDGDGGDSRELISVTPLYAESRITELEARHEADCAIMAKQAERIAAAEKNAERYLWLRAQRWDDSQLCTPRTNAIAGTHFIVHSLSNYWHQSDRWVKYEDVCDILSHAGHLERELQVAESQIKEIEAQLAAAEKSIEWARSLSRRVIFDAGTVHCIEVSRNPNRADWLEVRNAQVERVAQMILEGMKNE